MGIIFIETDRPIPSEVASDIRALRWSKAHHMSIKPTVTGGIIKCGDLALSVIRKKLEKKGISHTALRAPKSGQDTLRRVIYHYPGEKKSPQLELNGYPESLPPPSEIVYPEPERATELAPEGRVIYTRKEREETAQRMARAEMMRRARYKRWLKALGEPRRTSMSFVLHVIADSINAALEEKEPKLYPWHLVRLEETENEKRISLAPLNKAFPLLAQRAWNVVQSAERGGDRKTAEDNLVSALGETTENPDILTLFSSLASEGR